MGTHQKVGEDATTGAAGGSVRPPGSAGTQSDLAIERVEPHLSPTSAQGIPRRSGLGMVTCPFSETIAFIPPR